MDILAESSRIDPWLLNQQFFHGYLTREDLPSILRDHGDFLVRCSEAGKQKPREIIVSVMYDPEGKMKGMDRDIQMEAIRHIIVQSLSNNEQTHYYLDMNTKFPSIEELLMHHRVHPIIVNQVEVALKKGMPLATWEYPAKAVEVGKFLGTGPFGEIRKGKLTKRDGNVIDVSVRMMKGRSDICKQQMRELIRQARLMRELAHPNVLRFHGVCFLQLPVLVLIELVSGGALDAYLLDNKSTIGKEEKVQMIASAGSALKYLHLKEILLRDIAAKNCLYTANKLLKISEFGWSRRGTVYKIKANKKGNTKIESFIKWMAPESIRTYTFSQKTDVYSYGMLIYEIFACEEPYAKMSTTAAKEAVLSGALNQFPTETPSTIINYVRGKMWNMDPDKRATITEILTIRRDKFKAERQDTN
ncbi:hypothetical protein RB195_001167 [Necator americanus]|uniref:Tyrosine-protein kinase n=1 Tax=Necator americanus TaxID=51031 RepID=A0ABR1DCZ3_NECAM